MSTNFNISIELLESNKQISRKILNSIAEDFNREFFAKKNRIRDRIANIVINLIKNSDTYDSLLDGELAGHFGLPVNSRYSMVNNIVEMVGKNLAIDYKPIKIFADKFIGGAEIGVLIKNFTDLLSMSESVVINEKDGAILPWLQWLLIRGNEIIVSKHEIDFIAGKGRSGSAIMIKNDASVWKVPLEYAGTVNSNWLTRALLKGSPDYFSLVTNILKEELS